MAARRLRSAIKHYESVAEGAGQRASCVGKVRAVSIFAVICHFGSFLLKSVDERQGLCSGAIRVKVDVRFLCLYRGFFFYRV